MSKYYLNATQGVNGEYEVHKDGCFWLSLVKSKVDLGYYSTCQSAVSKAKSLGYLTADGCQHCSSACHSR